MYTTACFIITSFLGPSYFPNNQQLKLIALSSSSPGKNKQNKKNKNKWSALLWRSLEGVHLLCNIFGGLGFWTLPPTLFLFLPSKQLPVSSLSSQALKISPQAYESLSKTERRCRNENAGKENEKHLPSKLPGLDFKIRKKFYFKK